MISVADKKSIPVPLRAQKPDVDIPSISIDGLPCGHKANFVYHGGVKDFKGFKHLYG